VWVCMHAMAKTLDTGTLGYEIHNYNMECVGTYIQHALGIGIWSFCIVR
jgi:hypothetical protein